MAKQLEFYFPKSKSKHMSSPKQGKAYPSKGGTFRWGLQAIRDGGKSLPKFVTQEIYESYGFSVKNSETVGHPAPANPLEEVPAILPSPAEPTNENFSASGEVNVGQKKIQSRKDYDIENEYDTALEVGDIDLDDYENELENQFNDDLVDAIRESVDDSMIITDGDTGSGSIDVDTEIDITVPVSGEVDFNWTSNEEDEDEDVDNEWDAETFHSQNYNHTVTYRAEIEEYGDEVAVIRNRVGDSVGIVQLDDSDDDIEDVEVQIIDGDMEIVFEDTLGAESFNAEASCLWCEVVIDYGSYSHEGRPTDYCSPFCYNSGELGMDAESPSPTSPLYIKNSSIFDNPDRKYDAPLYIKILKEAGATKVWLENAYGWSNQPMVVIFTGLSMREAEKALDKGVSYGERMIISRKDKDHWDKGVSYSERMIISRKDDHWGAESFNAESKQNQAHIASLEMWQEAFEDNPNDEEAKEQYNYWYGVVHGGRETPYNPDYEAESCTCNDMFGSLCPQCNYDSDREGGVCPNGCTVDLAGGVRPQEMQIYTECRIHGQKLGAESFQAETFEAQAKTGYEVTTDEGSFYMDMIDYSKDHIQKIFKDWKPSAYPYEKRITQDSKNEFCNNCDKENVHYQFFLKQANSRRPTMRFVNGATYCQYDANECGANICSDCSDLNDCENCGVEMCHDCGEDSERIDSNKICVSCREDGGYDLDAEDSPSPSNPLEEVPATVPSPAEPTNESFNADFGKPTEGDFTTMQVRIGSPNGSTTSWTTSFNIQCVGEEDNLSYLTSDIEDVVVDRVKRWNGDDYEGDQIGDFIPMQIVIGSSSGNSGSWYRAFTVFPVGGEDNLSYLASDIEDVVVDRVKRWNGDEVSYDAENESFNAETIPNWKKMRDSAFDLRHIRTPYQVQMSDRFSCGCNIGNAEQPYHDMGYLYAHCATCGVPREIYPANHHKNAEDDMVICGGCEQARHSDSEFSIDNARSDVLDDGNVLCNYCWETHYEDSGDEPEHNWENDNYNADGTKTKTILGMTGLAIAIGLWKGNEIIAFIDKIKNAMK